MTNRTLTLTAFVSLLSVASMASARSYSSTESLQNLVRSDTGALSRYEAHFGMNRDEVINYFGELHLGKLAKAGRYAICMPAYGTIENQVTQDFPSGEAVFLDKSNTPVLLADGAYPMSETLSNTVQDAPTDKAPTTAAAAPVTSTETQMAMMQGADSSSTPNMRWLSAVPVLIPIIGMTNTGNGNGNGGSINPVPEPASMAVLGVGALGLLARRKKA